MDTVQRALPDLELPRRLFLPVGCDPERAHGLRGVGWVTVAGLDSDADAKAEARRLGCGHVLVDGRVLALED